VKHELDTLENEPAVPPDESPQVMKKIKKEEGSPTT
jgi:hypothetical protein